MKNAILMLFLVAFVGCSNSNNESTNKNNTIKPEGISEVKELNSSDVLITPSLSNLSTLNVKSGFQSFDFDIKNLSLSNGLVQINLTYQNDMIASNSTTCGLSSFSKLQALDSCKISLLINTDNLSAGVYPYSFSVQDKTNGIIQVYQNFLSVLDTNNSGTIGFPTESTTCKPNYHMEARSCKMNVKNCSVLPQYAVLGTQTWNGAGYNACQITQCIANYSPINNECVSGVSTKTVTINKMVNQGYVSVYDLTTMSQIGSCDESQSQCLITVNEGQNISISSTGMLGYSFSNYADANCLGNNVTCNLTAISENKIINPIFSIPNPKMDVVINPMANTSNVTYTVTKNGITCDAVCRNSLQSGDMMNLTATPDASVSIVSIVANGIGISNVNTSVSNQISFTMGSGNVLTTINLQASNQPVACTLNNYSSVSTIASSPSVLSVSGMSPDCLIESCAANYELASDKKSCIPLINKVEFYDATKPVQIKISSPYMSPSLDSGLTSGEIRKIIISNTGTYILNPSVFTISDLGTQNGSTNVVTVDQAQSVSDLKSCTSMTSLSGGDSCNLYIKFSYLYDAINKNVIYGGVNYPRYTGSINFSDIHIGSLSFSLDYEKYYASSLVDDDSLSGKLYFFGSNEDLSPNWDDYKGAITNMDEGFFTQDQIVNEFNNVLDIRLYIRNEGQMPTNANPQFSPSSPNFSIVGHNCTNSLNANLAVDFYTPSQGSFCYVDIRIDFSSISNYSVAQYLQGNLLVGDNKFQTFLPVMIGIGSNSGIIYRDRHFQQQNITDSQGNSLYPGDAPYINRSARTNAIFLPNERPSEGICQTYNAGTQTCTAYSQPSPNYQEEILTQHTYPNDIRVSVANGTNHSVSVLANPIASGSTTNIVSYTFGGTCASTSTLAAGASCTSNIGFTTTTKPGLFNIKLKFTSDPLDYGLNAFVKVECDPDKTHEEWVNGELVCVPSIRDCDVYMAGKVAEQCNLGLANDSSYNYPRPQYDVAANAWGSVKMLSSELVNICKANYLANFGLSVKRITMGNNGKALYLKEIKEQNAPVASDEYSMEVFMSSNAIGKGRQIWNDGKWSMCSVNESGTYYSIGGLGKQNIFPDNSNTTSECYSGYTKMSSGNYPTCVPKTELYTFKCLEIDWYAYQPGGPLSTHIHDIANQFLWYPTPDSHIPTSNSYEQMNDPSTGAITRIYDTKYRLFEMTKPVPFSESLRYYDYSDMNNGKACPASSRREWN